MLTKLKNLDKSAETRRTLHTHTHTHTCNILKAIVCLGTICFCFSSLATTPDISANTTTASCADTILNTDGGTANIEINWEPNTIPLYWYADSNSTTPLSGEGVPTSCEYGGGLTPPPPPSKTGYTFKGWRVRPKMDFSTISVTNYISGYGKGGGGSTYRYCGYFERTIEGQVVKRREGIDVCREVSEFNSLELNEWKMQLGDGWLYGMAKCSAKVGDIHNWNVNYKSDWTATDDELNDASGDKTYCWCSATGFRPNNSDTMYASSNSLQWVYVHNAGGDCPGACPLHCANSVYDSINFRTVLVSQ